MTSILEQIVDQTKEDTRRRKREVTFRDLESTRFYERDRRDFAGALSKNSISVIAEVKKASPSKGIIREDFDAVRIAGDFIRSGADAISVLTDEPFFHGKLEYLERISDISPIPLLRKDFIIDPYHIKEARSYGADAVLLIVSILEGGQLSELLHACREHGLQALVECYGKEDLELLNWDEIGILGVNNRDLHTFEMDLHRGIEMLKQAPGGTLRVSESGLTSAEDLLTLKRNDIDAALIGEYFMRQPSPGDSLRQMLDEYNRQYENRVNT